MVGSRGWPGEMGVTAYMFCERFRDGVVQQPSNSFSNVGFILAGLWVGWRAMLDRRAQIASGRPAPNRMRASNLAPTLYASIGVLLGPGSMAMHASSTYWGGRLDVMSMFVWASFAIVYGWARLRDATAGAFLGAYLALAIFLCGLVVGVPAMDINIVFGVLVVGFGVIEFVIHRERRDADADVRWLVAAGGLFLLAFAIWIPSRTGGPLCDPDSLVQGHAAWHLLDAAAVACIFQFYRTEGVPRAGRSGSTRA